MDMAYNKKVRSIVFKKRRTGIEKDLVRMGKDQSKWAPNYKQPYMVKNAFFFWRSFNFNHYRWEESI